MRVVAVTASTEPADRVTVASSRVDDRFTVRFGHSGFAVIVTPGQLEELRIAAGLAQLERSGT